MVTQSSIQFWEGSLWVYSLEYILSHLLALILVQSDYDKKEM